MSGGCGQVDSLLEQIEPDQLALLASLFAIVISDGLTAKESAVLSAFLVSVSDMMALIAAHQLLLGEGEP